MGEEKSESLAWYLASSNMVDIEIGKMAIVTGNTYMYSGSELIMMCSLTKTTAVQMYEYLRYSVPAPAPARSPPP